MLDSSWQVGADMGRNTWLFMVFYPEGPVNFSMFVPDPVAMSLAQAKCNAGASAGMAVSHLCMLLNDLNKNLMEQL